MGQCGSCGAETEAAFCSPYSSSGSVWLIDLAPSPAGPGLQYMAAQAPPWTLCSQESQGITGRVGQVAAELPTTPLSPLTAPS